MKDTVHQGDSGRKEAACGAELVTPYRTEGPKGEQVEEMFDAIAPAYDFMNGAMTMGLHRMWRDRALGAFGREFASEGTYPHALLDIATGTGDVAFELAHRFPSARVTGLDLSEGMLRIARGKLGRAGEGEASRMRFIQGDSLAIPFADDTFDGVTVAYGVRNFERLAEGYREMYRVLRPGGVLCVIELSVPQGRLTGAAYRLYSGRIIPAVGRMVSGDSRAYSYLPESIAAAPQRREMALLMHDAGFRRCRWKELTFGAVTYYLARKPESTGN